MDPIFGILNASKVFNGATTILMNLGARHVMRDIPDSFDDFFENIWLRRFIVFCIAFMATRDVKVSILLTLLFILLFTYLLKPSSKAYILPRNKNKKPEVTRGEYINAMSTVKKYQKQKVK